jgi:hypothetical protein
MTNRHRVAIVIDERASMLLPALVGRCHVWLVDSKENTKAAEDYWAQSKGVEDELAFGVTTFTRQADLPEQLLDMALELVEDHHGEFAHDPPVDEVLVIGAKSTNAVFAVLRDWGYTEIQSEAEGLVAQKVCD